MYYGFQKGLTPVSYLFEADVCDVPQGILHYVGPFPLTQRILLSPDHIDIVRDVVCSVVSSFALAFALKPGVDVERRRGISYWFIERHLKSILL